MTRMRSQSTTRCCNVHTSQRLPSLTLNQTNEPENVAQKFLKIRCDLVDVPAIFSMLRANARSAYGRAHSKCVPKMGMTKNPFVRK